MKRVLTPGGQKEPLLHEKGKGLLLEKDRSCWQFLTVKATHGGQLGWIGEWVRGEEPRVRGYKGWGVRGNKFHIRRGSQSVIAYQSPVPSHPPRVSLIKIKKYISFKG